MTSKNKESTRYYSDIHEKSVCKALGARQQSNSGAGLFNKGDVVSDNILFECKTLMTDKKSFSIKKDWLDKNKKEAFSMKKDNSVLCFSFGPSSDNYYVVDEILMKHLVESLNSEEITIRDFSSKGK